MRPPSPIVGALTGAAAVAAVLLVAAPASSGPVPVAEGAAPAFSSPGRVPAPPGRLLPPDPDVCILPVGAPADPCPVPREPLVGCVVPVTDLPGGVVTDACRPPRQQPEGRIVPLLRPSR